MKTRKLENFTSKRGQQLPQSLYRAGADQVAGFLLQRLIVELRIEKLLITRSA
jgi:hypothetical protein